MLLKNGFNKPRSLNVTVDFQFCRMRAIKLIVLLIFTRCAMAQSEQVRGLLTDEKGEVVANANVVVGTEENDSVHYITDANGVFAFSVPSGSTNVSVRFSHVGYKTELFVLKSIPENGDLGTFEIKGNSSALNEVLVTGSLPYPDRAVYFPPITHRKMANDAYELINKLMLPDIKVNLSGRSVSTYSGQSVLLYINDKPAKQSDLLSLRPQNVVKIEHIESPGVDYGYDENIGSVIKIFVKRRETGLIAGVNAVNAVTTINGQNFVFGKVNKKKSEIGLNVNSMYTDVKGRNTSDLLTYRLQNGIHNVTRTGIDTETKFTQNEFEASYNFTNSNKLTFDIAASAILYDSPQRGNRQFITETGRQPYHSITLPTEKFHRPSVNAFFKHYLTPQQTISGNLVYTHTKTAYGYALIESSGEGQDDTLSTYGYTTKGNKHSLITELQYGNQLEKANVTIGLRYAYGHTVNRYVHTNEEIADLKDKNTYLYGRVSGRFRKFSYTAGIGVSYVQNRQNGMSSSDWILRPQLSVAALFGSVRMRYNGSITSIPPSLSQLSDNLLQQNRFEFLKGNPNLSAFHSMLNRLVVSMNVKGLNIQNSVTYKYQNNPIMPEITHTTETGNEKFTHTFANQKSFHQLGNDFTITYSLIKDILGITGSCRYLYASSKGNDYAHSLHYVSFGIQADLSLKSWSGGVSYSSKEKELYGETYTINSSGLNMYLNRQIGNFRLGFMFSNIFSKNGFSQTDVTNSRTLNKESILKVPSFGNLLMITFVWNIQKGKQHKTTENTFNNKDVDSGILKME